MKCAVITPIGPGHRKLYTDICLPSVQTAIAFDQGPFAVIDTFDMDDSKGQHGRSNRRNEAVRQASLQGFDWVFFLDADDQLTPNAFEAFGRCLHQQPDIDAAFGLICESDETGEPLLRDAQPAELSDFEAFLVTPPWLGVQIGCFVKTAVAAALPFDENLDTGEDYKFYLQIWENHCCRKFPEIFFVNNRGQHSTGPRSATGDDWRVAVEKMWVETIAANPIWTKVSFDDATARMRISNPTDIIQSAHIAGHFFDENGLKSLLGRGLSNPRVVDVGANIGNHTIWFCKVLNAEKIYPVEPNPVALALLDENLHENKLESKIDRRGLGLGLGRSGGRFTVQTPDRNNLGATRLEQDEAGSIEVVALDDLMADETADLLKIDAEGMEMDVLDGATNFIARSRPIIWVEVLRKHQLEFAQKWCRKNRYRLADSWFYVHTVDYLAIPEEQL